MWRPATYCLHGDLRLRPALELLARVPAIQPKMVVDLGCGTGASTTPLRERFQCRVVGVDNSAEMLAKAEGETILGDAATWSEPSDLLFSNACLHWVEDHDEVIPRLLKTVNSGGVMAVQMPRNFDEPSHKLAREEAGVDCLPVAPVKTAVEYARMLLAAGAAHVDAWETQYVQRLTGDDAVFSFVNGTYLNPLRDVLSDFDDFARRYKARLDEAYPREPDGSTLFPFTRVFFVATVP